MAQPLLHEKIWFDQCKYLDAERLWQEQLVKKQAGGIEKPAKKNPPGKQAPQSSLIDEIARARQHIKNSLISGDSSTLGGSNLHDITEIASRIQNLEVENTNLKNVVTNLTNLVSKLDARVSSLENKNQK
ncbi:elongation factor 1-delta-like [Tachypleus tridentatus]|uniref:elongation factor 1-delta-like n=1 Tax=Tachypleus tridentatus TaxID=6853 RepID=UPI003FD0BEC9